MCRNGPERSTYIRAGRLLQEGGLQKACFNERPHTSRQCDAVLPAGKSRESAATPISRSRHSRPAQYLGSNRHIKWLVGLHQQQSAWEFEEEGKSDRYPFTAFPPKLCWCRLQRLAGILTSSRVVKARKRGRQRRVGGKKRFDGFASKSSKD